MKILRFATLVPGILAIALLEVIQTNPALSTLASYISASENATNFLASSNSFTFLAPSNEAISALVQSQGNSTLIGDAILATIQYGMLRAGFPTLSFSNESKFASTHLANPIYTNVTGGQAVELLLDSNGNPQVVSGNKTTAGVGEELICTGGIIHIIDNVLSIPIQSASQISAARMQYFISILDTAGYLDAQNAEYVDGIMRIPDVTYFIPNSADALGNATIQSANSTAEEMRAVFQYHVVPDFVGYSPALQDGMQLKTQEGSSLTITVQDGDIYVNSARVIASNYIVANGVIHVIDNLLDRFNDSPPRRASPTSTSTPSLANPTSASSQSPASDPPLSTEGEGRSSSPPGLSSGTQIAIGVGAGAGGFSVLAVVICYLLRRRKQKTKQSMLTPDQDRKPSPMASFYMKGGTIHTKDDGYATEYRVAGSGRLPSTGAGPKIPPRSPERAVQRRTSAEDTFF